MNTAISPKLTSLFFVLTTFIFAFTNVLNAHAETSQDSQILKQDSFLQLAMLIDEEKRPRFTFDGATPKSSWAFAFDNDVLVPGHRDYDYTYGVNLTYSGDNAKNAQFSLADPLMKLNDLIGILPERNSLRDNYSHEFGLFGFTPKGNVINPDDRPYASLIYFSSSIEQLDIAKNVAWKSSLTVGMLGLGFVGNLQNHVHSALGIEEAQGWESQISNGGEVTGRYIVARQKYLEGFSDSLEVKSTVQASVGYLTEASWSLSLRDGKILSPWVTFNPELISYGEKSAYYLNAEPTNEHYFWGGVTVKARFYNAFLQGQFRESEQTYSHSELRSLIAEAWVGYTFAFKNGYRFSYVMRGQTSEIKHGDGNRNLLWGGLVISKTM